MREDLSVESEGGLGIPGAQGLHRRNRIVVGPVKLWNRVDPTRRHSRCTKAIIIRADMWLCNSIML